MKKVFRGGAQFFVMSHFEGDELRVVLLEKTADGLRFVEETAVMTNETVRKEETAQFEKRLADFRLYSPVWIHVVLRHVAFTKVFEMPPASPAELDRAVAERIQKEVPYGLNEVMLKRIFQDPEGENKSIVVFGISKKVLKQQLKRLEGYDVIPDRVMLSAEILMQLYLDHVYPVKKTPGVMLLVHCFGRHTELMFFKGKALVQSRSFPNQSEDGPGLEDAIRGSLAAFQREWHDQAECVCGFSDVSEPVKDAIGRTGLPFESVVAGTGADSLLPTLWLAAMEAYDVEQTGDFLLPEMRFQKEIETHREGLTKLLLSVSFAACSLLIFAAVHIAADLGQMAWFQFKDAVLGNSVRELRQTREEAFRMKDFYAKKTLPVFLLARLSHAVPDDLWLGELSYDGGTRTARLEGTSLAQDSIDRFVAALEKDTFFSRLALEGVQAERDGGRVLYRFALKARCNTGGHHER